MNREQRERYEQRLQRTLLFNPPVEIQTQTLEGSPVFFSQGLNTPFFSSQELQGTLPFLFAIFACFAVRIPANYSGLSLWILWDFTTMTDLTRVWITGLQRRFTMVTWSRKSANGWETTLSGVPKWYWHTELPQIATETEDFLTRIYRYKTLCNDSNRWR